MIMTAEKPVIRPAIRPRDVAYRTLKRQILLNELPPSAPLTELGLAQEIGCSQGTVREALLRLQEDGLVQRAGHRGTFVTPLDAATAVEMLLLRRQIETRAAARVASRADAALSKHLQTIQSEMDECASSFDEFGVIEADIRFHMQLFAASGLHGLEQILHRLILHTHRQKLWEPRHRRPLTETAGRHRAIINAIPQGGEALAAALAQHIDTIVDIGADDAAPALQPSPRIRSLA